MKRTTEARVEALERQFNAVSETVDPERSRQTMASIHASWHERTGEDAETFDARVATELELHPESDAFLSPEAQAIIRVLKTTPPIDGHWIAPPWPGARR